MALLPTSLDELGLPAWLQMSNIKNAYDSIDRIFLSCMKLTMGFKPEGAVLWGRILLIGSTT